MMKIHALTKVMAAFLLTLVLFSCGDNGNPAASEEWDGGFVLPHGSAWVLTRGTTCPSENCNNGLVFYDDNTVREVVRIDGIWYWSDVRTSFSDGFDVNLSCQTKHTDDNTMSHWCIDGNEFTRRIEFDVYWEGTPEPGRFWIHSVYTKTNGIYPIER